MNREELDSERAIVVGDAGDSPRQAARALGWIVERFGLGAVVARTTDGRLMRVSDATAGCRAEEIAK